MIFTRCSSPVWNVPEQQKSRLLGETVFDGTRRNEKNGWRNQRGDRHEGGNRRSCEDTVT